MGEIVEYATTAIPLDSLPSLLQLNGDFSSNNFITPTAYSTQDGGTILILPQFSTFVLTGDGTNTVPIQQFVGSFAPENGEPLTITQEALSQSGNIHVIDNSLHQSVLSIADLSKKPCIADFGGRNVLILPSNEVATSSRLEFVAPEPVEHVPAAEDLSIFLHEDGRYHCDRCASEFDRPRQLKRHLEEHKKEKRLKCKSCTATFNLERNLQLHEASHNLTPNSSCPICDKRFLRVAGLCSHLRIHQVDDMLICEQCKLEFEVQSELDEHIANEHGADGSTQLISRNSYECRHCQVIFSELAQYRKHMTEHREVDKSSRPPRTRRRRANQADKPAEALEAIDGTHVPENGAILVPVELPDASETPAAPAKRGRGRARAEHGNKCPHCGKTFRSKMLLDRHILIHTGEKPFACDHCEKSFNQKSALNLHKLCHTGEKPHHCQFCFASFTQRGNLRAHIKSCHRVPQDITAPNIYRCGMCSCTFRRLSTYNAHLTFRHVETANPDGSPAPPRKRQRIVLPSKPSSSTITSEQATTSQLQQSLDDVAELVEQQPTVRVVRANSSVRNAAVPHLTQTNDQMPPADSLLYTYLPNVDNTVVTGEEIPYEAPPPDMPTAAPVLEETFDNVSVVDPDTNSVQHHRVTRVNGVLFHCCSFCEKRFRKTSDFVRHMRIHTCEKPFGCTICGNRFTNKSTLNTHMRVHAGPAAKRFRCHVCRKFFASPSSLKVHLRMHTGARPYKCSLCDKSFRTSSHRQDHMLKHQKTRQVIQQRVMAQAKQKQHERLPGVHHFFMPAHSVVSGEVGLTAGPHDSSALDTVGMEDFDASIDPTQSMSVYQQPHRPVLIDPTRKYVCSHCPKAYKKADHLRYHVESTHGSGERSYSCRICGKQFAMWAVLRNHIRTHAKRDLATSDQVSEMSDLGNYQQILLQHSLMPQEDMVDQVAETTRFELVSSSAPNLMSRIDVLQSGSGLEDDDFSSITAVDHICFHCGRQFPSDALVTAHVNLEHQEVMPYHSQQQEGLERSQPDRDDQIAVDCVDQGGNNAILVQSSWIPANELPELSLSLLQPPSVSVGVGGGTAGGAVGDSLLLVEQGDADASIDQQSSDADGVACSGLHNLQTMRFSTSEDGPGLLEQIAARQECPTIIIAGNMQQAATATALMAPPASPPPVTTSGGTVMKMRSRGNTQGIITHYHQETSSYEYRCSLCGAIFFTKQSISRHMTDMHSNRSAFKCTACHRQLSSQNALLLHMSRCQQSSGQVNPIDLTSSSLPLEAEELVVEQSLAVSQQSAAPSDNGPSTSKTCKFCGRLFQKPSDLVRHERTHTGARPFRCDQCGKSFRLKSALTGHQMTHQPREERAVHQCHLCKATLGSRASLVVHIRQHTGVSPYRCPHCPEKFRTTGRRQMHILAVHINPPQNNNNNQAQIDRAVFSSQS